MGQPHETSTTFIKAIFGFIGIEDVRFIYAEGLNISEDVKEEALEKARVETEAALAAL